LSGGLFDVSVGGRLVEWGVLPAPAGAPPAHPDASFRDIELLAPDRVRFRRPLWIDLGGIAKGYAVDRAIETMALAPDIQACVEAGGDLRIAGPAPERIRLRTLQRPGDPVPVLELENGALASSSGRESMLRHHGRRIGPHLDARRRRGVGTHSFVSVVAERCVMADGLTKIVLAQGLRAGPLLRRCGAAAYLHNMRTGWRSIGVEN
jgi:thiamine biosynthesis lipoprotein